ncbi:MAG: hypothetical protein FJW90_00240 [Actinobacteria bacterium]|nr:hypothetical protein [Actinomycetota bacterium]
MGDEQLDAPAGTACLVRDPDLRRRGEALEDGTVVLAVGGWSDRAYHSLPWEPIYLAQDPMLRGDWAEAAEILETEAGEQREHPFVRYRLACCRAQLGEEEVALEELRLAIEANPALRERAREEEQLAPLRSAEGWDTLTG